MKRNTKLLLLIPVIVFFATILLVLFSPLKIIPCETSATSPATSWNKDVCKGYYLTINQTNSANVNSYGLLINLALLICGSFLGTGILFILLFIYTFIKGGLNEELSTTPPNFKFKQKDINFEEEVEKEAKPKRNLFTRFKKDKITFSDETQKPKRDIFAKFRKKKLMQEATEESI